MQSLEGWPSSQLYGQFPSSHKNTSFSSASTSQVTKARRGEERISLDRFTSQNDCSHLSPCAISRCNPASESHLLRPDRNIVYDNPLTNGYGKYATDKRPHSDYQEYLRQPSVSAQTFCHNTPTRPLPTAISHRVEDARYESIEPCRIPIAAVGSQFADYSKAPRASHFSQYQQSFDPVLPTSHNSYPGTAVNASTAFSEYPFPPSYASDGKITGFYGNRTDFIKSGLPNSQQQNPQILGRNGDLVSRTHSRTLAGHDQPLNQDPELAGSAQPGYIQRTDPPYLGERYANGATDSASMTPHHSWHGSAGLPLQTSYGHPSMLTSSSNPRHFPSDFPSSRYEPPPFSAFTASGNTHVSTRSSVDPLHAQRATLTPTSTELPSTTSSGDSYRQSRPSQSSSDDPAVCPHCDQIVSRATKRADRLSNLNRHIRDKHKRAEGAKPICPEPGCGKTFERSDYVIRHRRKSHGFQSSNAGSWSG